MPLIATWNVNSVKARLQHLERFAKEIAPDIILLQELKCMEPGFPWEEVESMGYNVAVYGQKSYNGVAILSKSPLEDVKRGFGVDHEAEEARYIEAFTNIDGIPLRVASVYVPNGQDPQSAKFAYKLKFFQQLIDRIAGFSCDEIVCLGGDFNVAPEPIDVYNTAYLEGSVGFHIAERKNFRKMINIGMFDAFRTHALDQQAFSWWDYRSGSFQQDKGMRIDHILLSARGCDLMIECDMYRQTRSWQQPSDHIPVLCRLEKKRDDI